MGALPHRIACTAQIKNGRLKLMPKVGLPDGEVEVTINSVVTKSKNGPPEEDLLNHPAFGMWKNRKDIKSGRQFAKKIRDKIDKEFMGARNHR